MKKSDIKIMLAYFTTYVNQASDEDILPQLEKGGISLYQNNIEKLKAIGTKVYAQGKWTIPQIIEHITDCERIFQYRALRFARQDKTELSGFDENIYAAVSKANDRTVEDLLNEFQIVRNSSVALFKNLDNDQLQFTGKANGNEVSVLALGFIMIGHSVHHFNVIQERYFGLV